jgi:hypothetical protein
MESKKIKALFLFLVLSIQVLPFRQIAAWLSSNAATEEIVHNLDPVKAKSGMSEINSDFQNFHSLDINLTLSPTGFNYHHDESLIVRHPDDILAPPPNVVWLTA